MLLAAGEITRRVKGVKMRIDEHGASASFEMFVRKPDHVAPFIRRLLQALQCAKREFVTAMEKAKASR
jgi:hypothetical protein